MRLPIPALLVLLSFAPGPVSAQSTIATRVCVVGRNNQNVPMQVQQLNSTPQSRHQRDLVVKYLNQHKSPANSSVAVEAVALDSKTMSTVNRDAEATSCTYLVTVCETPLPRDEVDTTNSRYDSSPLSGNGLPPPAPLNFSILRREPAGWWNGLRDGSYNSSKWFAKDIADEVYATILKMPTP